MYVETYTTARRVHRSQPLVRREGVEPSRSHLRGVLSALCLPFHHPRIICTPYRPKRCLTFFPLKSRAGMDSTVYTYSAAALYRCERVSFKSLRLPTNTMVYPLTPYSIRASSPAHFNLSSQFDLSAQYMFCSYILSSSVWY